MTLLFTVFQIELSFFWVKLEALKTAQQWFEIRFLFYEKMI